MNRSVSEVLEMINESIIDVMHNINAYEYARGADIEEHMVELRFLLDEYRNLYHAWDLSTAHHRIKEMYGINNL
jgi:hypothetical protein